MSVAKDFLTVVITYRIRSTAEIVWDNVMDVSHFRHKHWKRFRDVNVLFREGDFEILQYNSYVLWPLPLTKSFVVVRRGNPADRTIRNVFHDLDNSSKVYINIRIVETPGGVDKIDHVIVERSGFAAMFPKLYVRILLRRLRGMYLEDLEVWEHRFDRGGFSSPLCEPRMPALAADLDDAFSELLARYPETAPAAFRFQLSAGA